MPLYWLMMKNRLEHPKTDVISEDRTAGCDAGIKTALVVSYPDGTVKKFDNHHRLTKGLKRLKIEQKILVRKKVSFVEQTNSEGKTFQQRLPSKGYCKQREPLNFPKSDASRRFFIVDLWVKWER